MIDTTSSKTVYEGHVFNIRIETARKQDGDLYQREIVDHPGGVAIVPLDEQDRVVLVRQYRAAIGSTLLEIPAGTIESGESACATASRELREEIGMCAEKLCPIVEFYLAPGYTTELMHIFLATGLTPNPLPADVDEEIELEFMPFDGLLDRVILGEIRDAKTIAAALFVAQQRQASQEHPRT